MSAVATRGCWPGHEKRASSSLLAPSLDGEGQTQKAQHGHRLNHHAQRTAQHRRCPIRVLPVQRHGERGHQVDRDQLGRESERDCRCERPYGRREGQGGERKEQPGRRPCESVAPKRQDRQRRDQSMTPAIDDPLHRRNAGHGVERRSTPGEVADRADQEVGPGEADPRESLVSQFDGARAGTR